MRHVVGLGQSPEASSSCDYNASFNPPPPQSTINMFLIGPLENDLRNPFSSFMDKFDFR